MAIYKVTYWNEDTDRASNRSFDLVEADRYSVIRSETNMVMDSIVFFRGENNTVVKEIFCRPRFIDLIENGSSENTDVQI